MCGVTGVTLHICYTKLSIAGVLTEILAEIEFALRNRVKVVVGLIADNLVGDFLGLTNIEVANHAVIFRLSVSRILTESILVGVTRCVEDIGSDVPTTGIPLTVVTLEAELYTPLIADALTESVLSSAIGRLGRIGILKSRHTDTSTNLIDSRKGSRIERSKLVLCFSISEKDLSITDKTSGDIILIPTANLRMNLRIEPLLGVITCKGSITAAYGIESADTCRGKRLCVNLHIIPVVTREEDIGCETRVTVQIRMERIEDLRLGYM